MAVKLIGFGSGVMQFTLFDVYHNFRQKFHSINQCSILEGVEELWALI